jgi:hypothetical protein
LTGIPVARERGDIVSGPEGAIGSDLEQDEATRDQHPMHLSECVYIIGHPLVDDYIDGQDDIEALRSKWKRGG